LIKYWRMKREGIRGGDYIRERYKEKRMMIVGE
jgi:hypothetical protein